MYICFVILLRDAMLAWYLWNEWG